MKSIKKISETHYYVFLFTLLIILFAFLHTLYGSIYIPSLDTQSNETIGQLNKVILSLDEDTFEEEINILKIKSVYSEYKALESTYSNLNNNLKKNLNLPKMNSNNASQIKEKLPELRLFVGTLKGNLSNERNRFNSRNSIFITFTLILALIQLVQISSWRKNQLEFIAEVNNGVKSIQDNLQYKSARSIIHPEQDFEEIFTLNKTLVKIEKEILFDREILDIKIHGDLDTTIQELYSIISKEMVCDRLALAFLNKNGKITSESVYTSYDKVLLEAGYSSEIDDSTLSNVKHSSEPRVINDLEKYILTKYPSQATHLIYQEGIRSSITYPILFHEKCVGFLFISSINKNVYQNEQIAFGKRVMALLKHKLYIEYILQDIIAQTSNSFVKLMDLKDNETSMHIKRMSHYSYIIAKKYMDKYKDITPKYVREIFWFSPLHDIGKVGIPDNILLKPGSLDNDEWNTMKKHVDIGEEVIEEMNDNLSEYFSLPAMQTAVEIIKGHHEKYDGNGYPRGIMGDDIPLSGRIVSLADVFDALTSIRPYKKAFTIDDTLHLLENEMKDNFDPKVYSCFKESLEDILIIYNKYKEV